MKELIHKIETKVLDTFLRAQEIYKRNFKLPNIRYDLHGAIAGQANFSLGFLKFNLPLAQTNEENFLNDTVPHECAHWFQRELYGYGKVKHHGPEWKKIMRDFGLEPSRCHSYDLTKVKQKRRKYLYKCNCTTHAVGAAIHRKVMYHGQKRHCKKCKGDIVFLGIQQ